MAQTIVEDADIYGNKVGSPDYRPWNDPDYGFKHRSNPIARGLIAVFWAGIVALACYGIWALVGLSVSLAA